MQVWPIIDVSEEFLRRHPERFRGLLLLVGVKGLREVPFAEEVRLSGGLVVVLEPWPQNADYARHHYQNAEVLCMTIEQYVRNCIDRQAQWPDVVVWLQGPEHLPRNTALETLEELRQRAGLVLAEMPHGRYVQGADGGNPYEEHRSYLYPHDFDDQLWQVVLTHDEQSTESLVNPDDRRHLMVASWVKG